MENLFYGLVSVGERVTLIVKSVFYDPLFWGVVLGFLLATLVYLFFSAFRVSESAPLFCNYKDCYRLAKKLPWYRDPFFLSSSVRILFILFLVVLFLFFLKVLFFTEVA
jgi:hypothetical protein